MAVDALLVDWQLLPNGNIRVVWGDGHSNTFADLQDVKDRVSALDSDPAAAESLLLAWFLARQPDASNTNIVEGKRLTFDLSNASPIKVQ